MCLDYNTASLHLGGATVFPYAGTSIFPSKGSGVMWYNLFRNGDPDMITIHKACAVLLGNKWIGNKWIGYNGQWNGRKCGLYENSIFDSLLL